MLGRDDTRSVGALRVLIGVVFLGLVMTACGGEATVDTGGATTTEGSGTTAAPTTTEGATTTEATGTTGGGTGEEYRVALIYPGTKDDLSWSNAWWDGAQRAMDEHPNLSVESVELLNDPDAVLQQGSAFASQGYDMILIAHGAMPDPAMTLAQQFPDVQVCLAPHDPGGSAEGQPDNLCWIDVAQHDADFFAGALAAMVTQTGHIASLNGFAFPALTRQPEAFHLGARCVNPDIEFSQQYMETWTDTGISKSAAQSMIAAGADVILSATDSAVFGILQAAQEASSQVWVVPSYYESQSLAPEVVLTSAIHGLSFASTSILDMAVNGEIPAHGFIDYTAVNDPEIQAPLYPSVEEMLTEDQLVQYQDIVDRVRAGDITIPDETSGEITVGAEGSGGEIDLAAIGCA